MWYIRESGMDKPKINSSWSCRFLAPQINSESELKLHPQYFLFLQAEAGALSTIVFFFQSGAKAFSKIQNLQHKNPSYGIKSISRPKRMVAPIPQQGGPRIPKNSIFLKNGKNYPKLKNIQKFAKTSDTAYDRRSLIHQEAWFLGGPRIPKKN